MRRRSPARWRISRRAPRSRSRSHYHVATTTNSDPAVGNTADASSDEDTDAGQRHGRRSSRTSSSASSRPSTRDTVTAGGANADLHDRRAQQRRLGCRQREPDRHGRRAADRRLDRGRRLHVRPGGPVDRLHARRISRPATTKSITVTYHVDTTTNSAAGVEQHGVRARRTRTARPRAATRSTSSRTCSLASTKTFDSTTVTAGGATQTFTIDVTNNGVSDADNVSLTDSVDSRLIVDSIDAGDYTCARAEPVDLAARSRISRRARRSRSRSRTTSTPTTESDPSVPNTAHATSDEDTATPSTRHGGDRRGRQPRRRRRRSPTTRSTRARCGHTFTIDVQNTGVSEADNLEPHRHRRPAPDRRRTSPAATPARTATRTRRRSRARGRTSRRARRRRSRSPTAWRPRRRPTRRSRTRRRRRRMTAAATSDGDTVAITTHADVADVKVDSPDPVLAGNDLTFRITATQRGPSDAQNVVVHDTLDAHLNLPKYCLDTGLGCTPLAPWTGSVNLGTLRAGRLGRRRDHGDGRSEHARGPTCSRTRRRSRLDTNDPNTGQQHVDDDDERRHRGRSVGDEDGAGDRDCGRPGRLRLHADGAQRRPVGQHAAASRSATRSTRA